MISVNKILKAEHVQIFFICFLLPFFLKIIASFFAQFSGFGTPGISSVSGIFGLLAYYLFLSIAAWFWSVGFLLKDYISKDKIFDFKYFKWAIVFIAIIVPIVSIVLGEMQELGFITANSGFTFSDPITMFLAFVYILLYMSSSLWIFIYISRGLAIATLSVHSDSILVSQIKYFFLLLFLPLGIWFIQPRINKLVSEESE